MRKRTFLKMSSASIADAVFSRAWAKGEKLKNWAGNLTYSTENVFYPESLEQVQELVKKTPKLRVLGTQHCFNRIADSPHNLVSTKKMAKVVSLDTQANTVTVEAGIRYGTLAEYLVNKGYALHNLASLPHISVAGACATATHGSGIKNGNLASAVAGIEFVTDSGEVVNLTRGKDSEQFNGAVVNLGGIGVVTKVTLDIQPTFQVRQDVYENLPFGELERNFEAIMSSSYSVSLFTNWLKNNVSEVWVKSRIDGGAINPKPEFFGAKLAKKNLHPIAELDAINCTEQMGVPGPWHERLPHFRMNFTPSSGKELQSEFFVPLRNAYAALSAINRLGNKWSKDIMISEIRTIAADNLWMSTAYNQTSVAIHFTWKQNTAAVMKLIPVIEKELAPFGIRPHWGKLFTVTPAQLKSRYERFADFQNLLKQYDPQGKFRNEFLDRNIFGI